MDAYLGKTLYSAIQSVRCEPVSHCLDELEQSQSYSSARLRDIQWTRVSRLLNHAYETVPFYRERFDSVGLKPLDIRAPGDLARIPALTKQDLRSKRRALMSARSPQGLSAVATSGSSGDPLTVIRDRTSTAYHRAAKYRGHRWFGIDIGDREARLWGVPVDPGTRWRERFKDFLMNRIRASAYELDGPSLLRFYRQVTGFRPSYLFGYPSLVYEFARLVLDEGIDGRKLGLKAAITTSETLYPFQRAAIRQAFGCPAVNEYGCTETGIIAFECPAGGMHIPVEAVYVEIVPDSTTGVPGLGRVILTDLHNFAMPIIRYDIGDMAVLSDERCACGRSLPLLKEVVGRASNIIVTPDGRRIHTIIFYYILYGLESKGGGIKKFQVVREGVHSYVMRLVRDGGFRDEDLALVRQKILEYLGDRVSMRYEFVDAIERTEAGKHRDYVDLVQAEK